MANSDGRIFRVAILKPDFATSGIQVQILPAMRGEE
jgi:hypothetical protein